MLPAVVPVPAPHSGRWSLSPGSGGREMILPGFAVDSGSEFVCEADALESAPTGGAGCGYSTVTVTFCGVPSRLRTMTWGVKLPMPAKGESLVGTPRGKPDACKALACSSSGKGKSMVEENPVAGSVILPLAINAGCAPA